MMQQFPIILLLACSSLLVAPATSRAQAHKWSDLASRSLQAALDDTETIDQQFQYQARRRIAIACAMCGQVELAVNAIDKLSKVPDGVAKSEVDDLICEVGSKFAEANSAEIAIKFGSSVKATLAKKNQMFADAASVYANERDFESASELVKQIQDSEAARVARIGIAFLSDNRKACHAEIASRIQEDVKSAKSGGGWSELHWVVVEIALLKWSGKEELAENLIEDLDKNFGYKTKESGFTKDVNVELQSWLEKKNAILEKKQDESVAPDTDDELHLNTIVELLDVKKRSKPQTEKLISVIETLCQNKVPAQNKIKGSNKTKEQNKRVRSLKRN